MIKKTDKNAIRRVRHYRVRKKINGTADCPRLNVYRSLNNIYVQLIDDVAGHYAQRIALTPLLTDDPVGVDLLAEMAG